MNTVNKMNKLNKGNMWNNKNMASSVWITSSAITSRTGTAVI